MKKTEMLIKEIGFFLWRIYADDEESSRAFEPTARAILGLCDDAGLVFKEGIGEV